MPWAATAVVIAATAWSGARVRVDMPVGARRAVAVRMDAPHPWSASSSASASAGLDDEMEELPALPVEAQPSAQLEPLDVIKKVLEALRSPDEPYENYGPQVAIAFSSPANGASKLTPSQFAEYLSEGAYQIFCEWDEMEIEDELELTDGGERAYQEVMVRRAGDTSWTHINWTLEKCDGLWMTESVVTY